jgi:hypothetical protein
MKTKKMSQFAAADYCPVCGMLRSQCDCWDAVNQLPSMPDNWEACTVEQLEHLRQRGTYGQRRIAERHLSLLPGKNQ